MAFDDMNEWLLSIHCFVRRFRFWRVCVYISALSYKRLNWSLGAGCPDRVVGSVCWGELGTVVLCG